MILTLDAGNSRTKWAVFDSNGMILSQGAIDNGLIPDLKVPIPGWRNCSRAVISNVAGARIGQQLQTLCQQLGLQPRSIKATAAACGVSNHYLSPEQLGADRWAALVAAWNRFRVPCVVAMAGTALTVDALSADGEFLGGLIVPGWRMMNTSLATGTAELTEATGQLRQFPLRTQDAICSGTWLAMAGAVESMVSSLAAREQQAPLCILSGGDATGLKAALSSPAEIIDNLVLQGLWLIDGETREV